MEGSNRRWSGAIKGGGKRLEDEESDQRWTRSGAIRAGRVAKLTAACARLLSVSAASEAAQRLQ